MSGREYRPFKDRLEHDYLNKMTALIVRCRKIIKDAEEVVGDIKDTTESYLKTSAERTRKEDERDESTSGNVV